MRYFYCLSITFFLLVTGLSSILANTSYAAPTNDTNIAREISFSITSTFENTGGLFDGVVDSTPKFSALTGDISKFIQQVIVPLKNPAYLREIKVFWDKEAYTLDYNIQYSRDGRKWFNLKRTKIEEEQNSFVHFFDGAGHSSQRIRIIIPHDKRQKGIQYRIQEIEIYPNMDNRNTIEAVNLPVITDTEAFLDINSTLDGDKYVELTNASQPNATPKTFRALHPNEAINLISLNPNESYFYVANMLDFNRNLTQGDRTNFRTEGTNLALRKPVSGTFSANPGDSGYQVQNSLEHITDGGYDFFTQSSTSGSLYDSDQYFTIDLQQISPIRKIVLFWRGLSYPNQYQVQTSNDNQNWTTVLTNLDADQGVTSRVPAGNKLSPAQIHQINLENIQARYLKILVPKNSRFTHTHSNWEFVQIYEAKVF